MKKQLLKKNMLSFSALVFLLGAFNVSQAQYTWVGGTSTDFKDATNWNTTPVFSSSETFTVGVGSSNNPILGSAGYTLTSGAPTVGGIVLNDLGNLTISGNMNVNSASYFMGTLTVNGGLLNVRNSLYFGSSSTAGTTTTTANVEVGGTLNTKTFLIIGQKQPAIFNINGGIVSTDSAGSILVGNYPQYAGSNGTLNINAGTLKVFKTGGLTIGTVGLVNIDGGKIELTGDQTAAITTHITNNVLKVSGAALTAGKILSNTYDSVTGLTTVMAVLPGTAPSALDYTTTAGSYTVGTAIADNSKSALTLGTGTTATYSVSPALPSGLALDATTGTISGTPTAVKAITTYFVKATTDYGFTTKAITMVISAAALGVSEFEESAKIAVYPNPTTDTVTVSLPNNVAIEKIAVYNSLGQLMSVETKNTVSLQNLASGNYYLTIYTAEGNYAKKVIKQ